MSSSSEAALIGGKKELSLLTPKPPTSSSAQITSGISSSSAALIGSMTLLSPATPPSSSSSSSVVVSTNAGSSDYDFCKIVSGQKYNKKQETSLLRPTEREKNIKATDPVVTESRDLQARPVPLYNLSGHEQTHIQSQSYEITGSSSQPVDKNMFSLDEHQIQISDFEYFKQKHDIVLKYQALPALQSGSNARPIHLPIEPLYNSSGREPMVVDPPVEQWIKEDKASYYGACSSQDDDGKYSTPKKTLRDDCLNETCVLLLGGFNVDNFDVYFPLTDVLLELRHTWYERSCPAAGILNGHIFVFGGAAGGVPMRAVQSYVIEENEWDFRRRMNLPRYALAGGVFDGRLFALGGRGRMDEYYSCSEWFDLNRNRWISTGINMHDPRAGHAAVELGGSIYVCGGQNVNGFLNTTERYDPREPVWNRIADMELERAFHSLVVFGGRIYAIGGRTGDYGLDTTDSVEVYDPRMGIWQQHSEISVSRSHAASPVIGNSIYLIGGCTYEWGEIMQTSIDRYREEDGAWTIVHDPSNVAPRGGMAFLVYSDELPGVQEFDAELFEHEPNQADDVEEIVGGEFEEGDFEEEGEFEEGEFEEGEESADEEGEESSDEADSDDDS